MDQPPLGHKEPRPGRGRLLWCPACSGLLESPTPLTSRYVTFSRSYIPISYVKYILYLLPISRHVWGVYGHRSLPNPRRSAMLLHKVLCRRLVPGNSLQTFPQQGKTRRNKNSKVWAPAARCQPHKTYRILAQHLGVKQNSSILYFSLY